MQSIFEQEVREKLIDRIDSLSGTNMAQWGKMNVCQMIKHCSQWDEWMLGVNNPVYKQALVGKLFGKMVLRKVTRDDEPLARNTPTASPFIIKETDCDIAAEKSKWIDLIRRYAQYNNPGFIHMFFGKMTKEQVGLLVYKHADHHLRQFGA